MDLTGYIILIFVTLISIYDFHQLKKLKIKVSKCLWSAVLTFVLSVFAAGLLSALLSMPFGNALFKDEVYLILALILILIFNYYRIKGRKISKGKVTRDEKSGFNNIITGVIILFYICLFSSLTYVSIKYSFVLWDKTLSLIEFGNYGLGGTAIVIINNILVSIFGTIANKVASICLFLLGIFALAIFSITGYSFLQNTIFKKRKK
tara:strand:+ start:70 stop:687 length:618 start_codon:yes stop_codon:yes gene_type:complete